MYCLDTYALWEIYFGNPKFAHLINESFVVTEWTLMEFYKTLIKEQDKETAMQWIKRFEPYSLDVPFKVLLMAVDFQHENKKEDLSLFDCVGYIFSKENNYKFVTGDKKFKQRNSTNL